jgi:hypothetical protein
MADLEQSLATFKEAAKGRQVARAELDAATEWFAGQIVGPLRSGDSVMVYRTQAGWVTEVGDERSASETVTVSVERVTWPVANALIAPGYTTADLHGANALIIGNAVLTDPRLDKRDRRIGLHANLNTTREPYDLHLATGEERLRFVALAPAIVEAFRKLAETQAEEYAKGADAVSRKVVR